MFVQEVAVRLFENKVILHSNVLFANKGKRIFQPTVNLIHTLLPISMMIVIKIITSVY